MGRWTQYDEDSYRLPEGMVRVGYDADTQQYIFRDATDGSQWTGAPGCEYGRMTKSSSSRTEQMFSGYREPEPEPKPQRSSSSDSGQTSDPWSAEQQINEKDVNTHIKASWKMSAPFLLLIYRLPMLAYRFFRTRSSADKVFAAPKDGGMCWGIAHDHVIGFDELRSLDIGMDLED